MMEQRSPEWFAARLGKVTASRVADILAVTKSGPSASRKNYMAELVAERLTGQPAQGFTSPAMQWGTDNEPMARAAYEFMTDATVEQVGFVDHPHIANFGASPDGLVGAEGLVEIKCPNTATHLDTLLGAEIDARYVTQMQVQMACTGRKWCDFVSFDPRLPGDMRIHIRRVEWDDDFIAKTCNAVSLFLGQLDATVAELRQRFAA